MEEENEKEDKVNRFQGKSADKEGRIRVRKDSIRKKKNQHGVLLKPRKDRSFKEKFLVNMPNIAQINNWC